MPNRYADTSTFFRAHLSLKIPWSPGHVSATFLQITKITCINSLFMEADAEIISTQWRQRRHHRIRAPGQGGGAPASKHKQSHSQHRSVSFVKRPQSDL